VTERDPFDVLGIEHDASLAEAREARRRLAFDRHPDRGGNADEMREINAAFDAVVGHLTGRRPIKSVEQRPAHPPPGGGSTPSHQGWAHQGWAHQGWAHQGWAQQGWAQQRWVGPVQHDDPSFVINALPAEAFEALLVVASWIGEVLIDDPPYVLDVHLFEPAECWCRLELLPEAGASTVILTVAAVGSTPAPLVEDVRDVWVHNLNLPGAFG
jgi:hypothetical protein